MIYSQYYLMSRGIAISWDNPDIQLFEGLSPVSSDKIGTSKTYTIHADILNGSVDAPVVNLLVRFYYLSFGIGTIRHYIGETFVDVPVKGAAGLPAKAEHTWTTPATAGHYCIQVNYCGLMMPTQLTILDKKTSTSKNSPPPLPFNLLCATTLAFVVDMNYAQTRTNARREFLVLSVRRMLLLEETLKLILSLAIA